MLSLARNGYSAAAVTAALQALTGTRTLAYRYDLLDSTGVYKKALAGVSGASVSYNSANAIKRTCKFTILDDPAIVWASDRVKPYARILMPDGGYADVPLGVFLLSSPTVSLDPAGGQLARAVSGYDLLQVLSDTKTTDRYAVPAGTAYTVAVTTLLNAVGLTAQNITPAASTLPAAMEWDIGTPYLAIVDDLLAAVNYNALWFDADGTAIVQPYASPAARGADWTYANDSKSVLIPGMQRGLDLFAVPNQFVLVVTRPDRSVLASTYTNTNPTSPTSTVSRGRTITTIDKSQQAPDQATLDALAQRAAFDASQVYEQIDFATLVMPMHANLDMLQLVHSGLGISANYVELSWSIDCKPGGQMKHSVSRIVSI